MSTPARTIPPDETVARALVACQRYGQSGILVAEDGASSASSRARTSTAPWRTASRTRP